MRQRLSLQQPLSRDHIDRKADDDHCPTHLKIIGIAVILCVGLGFGLSLPHAGASQLQYLSSVLGWTYFAAWSISFYPQLYLNRKRRSVVGLSFDFELLNLIGFAAYSIFNCAFYFDNDVRTEYAKRNNGSSSLVQANDVVFATHATIITLLTIIQCFIYESNGQRVSTPVVVASASVVLLSTISIICIKLQIQPFGHQFKVLDWLYWLGYLKLGVSVVKYIPQVMLNHQRRSTAGWNIYNVLLDFSGGTLSIAQLLVDATIQESWDGVIGDPVKFWLGSASLLFDVIFMAQHYCLYNHHTLNHNQDSFAPFLPNRHNQHLLEQEEEQASPSSDELSAALLGADAD